jgi:hypothetical protein
MSIDRRFGLDAGDRSTIYPVGPSLCFAFARVWLKCGLNVETDRWQASQACDVRNAETLLCAAFRYALTMGNMDRGASDLSSTAIASMLPSRALDA